MTPPSMADTPGGFASKAAQFIRNPLGIIGLFIVMIYSTTVIVSGASGELTDGQRWVLVGFAALFPFVVLAAFYNLVTKHHAKLYSPGDWKDEKYVFGPQTQQVKQKREEAELEQIAEAEETESQPKALPSARPEPETMDRRTAPQPSPSPVDRHRNLLQAVRDAESLAFGYITSKYDTGVFRDVTIHGGPKDVSFDGLSDNGEEVTVYEVKLIRSLRNVHNSIYPLVQNVALASAAIANSVRKKSLNLVLVIVTDGMDQTDRSRAGAVAERLLGEVRGVETKVDVIDLSELREKYESGKCTAA